MAVTESPTSIAATLRGRKLSRWVPWAIAAAAVVVTVGLFAGLGALNIVGVAVTAATVFAIALTVVSFSVEGSRQAKDRLCTTAVHAAFVLALAPLVAILAFTAVRGASLIGPGFLTHSMFLIPAEQQGGGVYHAIVGTLLVSVITALIAVPIGILTAVYLVEYGTGGRLARSISFFVDLMMGVPSIVAGLFIYAFWLIALGFEKSGVAGSLALVILMLPVVIRNSEEMLKLVPTELREASYALGVPKWKTIWRIVLPTAFSGIVTGVVLGVARAMGETAPLLLLVGVNDKINFDPFSFDISTLPTYIYNQFTIAAGNTTHPAFFRAWSAAFVLIVIIMLLNLLARVVARYTRAR